MPRTSNGTDGYCLPSGTNWRRRERWLPFSCLPQGSQKAISWTAPAPMPKRSFKSAYTKPTGGSSRQLKMRSCGYGQGRLASVELASIPFPRRGSKLCRGLGFAETVRSSQLDGGAASLKGDLNLTREGGQRRGGLIALSAQTEARTKGDVLSLQVSASDFMGENLESLV